MSEWKEASWGEIVSLEYGKSLKGKQSESGSFRVYGSNGPIGWTEKKLSKGPGVILGRKGAYRGIEYSIGDFWVIDTAYFVKPLVELDIKWIYYAMIGYKLGEIDDGSPIPSTPRNFVYKDRLKIPSIPEQKAIAHILGTLDDKIELNRQMNQTLEAMAQALFKSWFVDFDPVMDNLPAGQAGALPNVLKSKYEKRQLVPDSKKLLHTNPSLAAQFPSAFVFNEVLGKWIPEGWVDTNMNECLATISKTYNLKKVEQIIFLNTGDIEDGRFLHNNYSKSKGLPGQAKKSIQAGDILYSEIRPKNKRFAYVYFDSSEYVVSTKLMVLRPKNEVDSLFYYQILKAESTLNELQFLAESRSGTFPQITFDTLKAIRFVLPDHKGILNHYTKVLKTNFDLSIANQNQIETLTQLRDRLLPELISGRVRVTS